MMDQLTSSGISDGIGCDLDEKLGPNSCPRVIVIGGWVVEESRASTCGLSDTTSAQGRNVLEPACRRMENFLDRGGDESGPGPRGANCWSTESGKFSKHYITSAAWH